MSGKAKRPAKTKGRKPADKPSPPGGGQRPGMVFDESRRMGLSVINCVDQGVTVYDKYLRYKLWNPFMENMSGLRAVDVIGKEAAELFPFLKEQGIIDCMERALKGESVQSPDFIFDVAATGKKGWAMTKFVPHTDEQGRIIGVIGTITDITERKRVEIELQKSARHLQRAQEVADLGSWELDIEKNLLYWSDYVYKIFGVRKGVPLRFETFLAHVHPDDRGKVESAWKAALAGKDYDIEHRILVKKTVRWVREKAELQFDEKGRPRRGTGTVQDITARKFAEHRYRQLFEFTPSSVAVYEAVDGGRDFILRDFNAAAEKTECISRDKILGKRATKVFPGIGELGLLKVLRDVWKTGEPVHHPVGEYKDERIMGYRENFVFKLPSGEVAAAYEDRTERERASAEIRRSEACLRTIFEGVGDAIVLLDAETLRVTQCNRRACQSLGYDCGELHGMTPLDWDALLTPESAEAVKRQVLDEGRAIFDTKHRSKDGGLRDVRVSLRKTELAGKDCIVAVWGDKTLFREATQVIEAQETRWRALMTHLPNGFAVHEMIYEDGRPVDYRFLDINDAFTRLTGLSREDVVGKTVREALPGTEDAWIERYGKVAMTGEPAHFTNYSGKLGKWFQVWAYRPWPDHFAVIFTDVTDIEKTKLKT